jgi:hypothetical protein
MNHFNKIKEELFSKKSIATLFLAILISSVAVITPTKPANALFGVGDITAINIQEFVTDLAESLMQSFVESLAGQLASKAINGMISKYKIGSYLQYADNLSKQVYTVQAMNNDQKLSQDAIGQYVVQSMITDITTNPVQKTSLSPLLQKEALNYFNPNTSSTAKIGTGAENFLASSMNPLGGVGGQYFASLDKTTTVKTKSDTAANKDISTANGNKSSYSANCAKVATQTGQNNSSSASAATQTDCILQNPGAYVGNALSGELTGLFNRQSNPPNNHLATIATALGSVAGRVFAGIAEQSILGSGSSGAVADKATTSTTTPPPTTTTSTTTNTTTSTQTPTLSSYGTLVALDMNNNILASSSASVATTQINDGQTYSLNWNASGISGVQYVAFTPCATNNRSGSTDLLPVAGTKTETMSGASQTYTMQVWGTSGTSTTSTILETDTITVYSNGTLYALDSSNNLITGSSSTTSVAISSGQSYTINWNASGISGSQYAAFTPCSASDCSSASDKLSLSGTKSEKMSGAIQTYTLQVWGTSGGSSTVSAIETDTITVKSK